MKRSLAAEADSISLPTLRNPLPRRNNFGKRSSQRSICRVVHAPPAAEGCRNTAKRRLESQPALSVLPCSALFAGPVPGPVRLTCQLLCFAAAGLAGPESRTGWGQCLSACVLAVFLAGFNTLEQKQRHTFLLPAFALEFLTDRGKFLSGAGLLFRDGLLIPQAGLQFHVGSA